MSRLIAKHGFFDSLEVIQNNFSILRNGEIFDFTFNGWLEISEDHGKEIIDKTIRIYNSQRPDVHTYPDPLKSQLELIYILYINDRIKNIDGLYEIKESSDFLQFFLNPETFDYRKVDFSNYMWENILKHKRFRDLFVEHKEEIMPAIEKRIDRDEVTEMERMLLYGYMRNKDELL